MMRRNITESEKRTYWPTFIKEVCRDERMKMVKFPLAFLTVQSRLQPLLLQSGFIYDLKLSWVQIWFFNVLVSCAKSCYFTQMGGFGEEWKVPLNRLQKTFQHIWPDFHNDLWPCELSENSSKLTNAVHLLIIIEFILLFVLSVVSSVTFHWLAYKAGRRFIMMLITHSLSVSLQAGGSGELCSLAKEVLLCV